MFDRGETRKEGQVTIIFYKRYADDTLTAVKDILNATAFLATLNEAHPAISFTIKVEDNNKLPFIGMELIKILK